LEFLTWTDLEGEGLSGLAGLTAGDIEGIMSVGNKISFDSYGLPPPEELVKYLHSPVYCNSEQVQSHDEVFCGHLCLFLLKKT